MESSTPPTERRLKAMVASSTLVWTPLDSYELLKRDEVECPAKGDESEPKVDCLADPGLPPTVSKR